MKRLSIRKAIIIMMFALIVFVLPKLVNAANNDVAILNVNGDYAIYLNGKENAKFKFAFTNDKTITAENAKEKLNFAQNWDDSNKNSIACLEKSDATIDFEKTVYMWIQTEAEGIYSVELNLNNVLTQKEMKDIENLTQKIKTNTDNTITTTTQKNGVITTTTVGQLNITDSKDYKYKYELIKLDGNESEGVKKLNTLLDTLRNKYDNMSMFDKISLVMQIKDIYEKVLENAKLANVTDMVISQPEDSEDGDKYIVLVQKLSDTGIESNDVKFMNCTKEDNSKTEKEKVPVKSTHELPVTYDSIVLIIVLVVVVIALIAVSIRMRKLNEKD